MFDLGEDGSDLRFAENKKTGEKTYFHLRNRVWEVEVKIMPRQETEEILEGLREQKMEELCPFDGQVLLP